MKSLAFFAQRIVFGVLLLALLAVSAALLLLTLAFLYRPTALDVGLVIWHILLNGGIFALLLVVLIAGIYLSTRRRTRGYAGTSGPSSIAIMLLGLSLTSTVVVYAVLAFDDAVAVSLKRWLDILNLTDIAASGSVIATVALSYHIPHSALFPEKINTVISLLGQCVIIICLAVAVVMLPAVAQTVNDATTGPADDYAAELIPLIWVNLAGLAGVIGFLNWRHPSFSLAAIGAAAAVMTFASACCYTLLPPDSPPPIGGPYAIAVTAIPLLLFLAILLRRYKLPPRNPP